MDSNIENNIQFNGFTESDFNTFLINGLEERMEAIRERIQPKFKLIGEALVDNITMLVGNEMFLHIAKHARRTVNPPKDTWLAISNNRRGYKSHPHFQVGLFDDHLFLWLAFIYELPNKKEIADKLLEKMDTIQKTLPSDFVISLDHMQKDAEAIKDIDLEKALKRFRDIKKGEFLIGRQIKANDPILKNGSEFLKVAQATFETLVPIYQMSLQ